MDARVPERYLVNRRVMQLAPMHFRSFILATLWSVSNRTEGRVGREDVEFIPGFSPASPPVLVAAELWADLEDYWLIVEFAATQTSKAQLEAAENKRRQDRERQARHRSKGVQFEPTDPPGRDVTRDNRRDVTEDDKGKASARQGEDKYYESPPAADSLMESAGQVAASWPPVAAPGSGGVSDDVAVEKQISPQLFMEIRSEQVAS
jgi:hypothetical protein